MAQQKRYKLLIWFYLHNHLHKSIHAAHSMEVELTRKTEVSEWVDENDESIAKAYLIDRVKDTRETVIERNIERYTKTKDYELHSRRPDWSLGRNGPSGTSNGSSTTLMAI